MSAPLARRGILALFVVACAAPPTDREPGADAEDTAPDELPDEFPVDGGIVPGGVQRCADPAAREASPLFSPVEAGDFGDVQPAATVDTPTGWGTSVADFDGDGLLDVLLPQNGAPQLFRGDGRGRLDLVADAFRGAPTDRLTYASSAADYDGDGDLDVFLAAHGADTLWANDGTGRFTDVTAAAGLADDPWDSVGAAWADYDGDGDLDLFVANYWTEGAHPDGEEHGWRGDPNTLWENDGEGGFVDRSELVAWRNVSMGFTYLGGWWDVDGDRRPELHVINDKGDEGFANALATYDGTTFVDVGAGSGLDVVMQGMGLGAADLNGDDVPDFLVTDWGALHLLVSDGDGGWYDAAFARGLDLPTGENRTVPWGAELEDLDNDGDADATVTFGADNLHQPSTNQDGVTAQLRQYDGAWLQGEDGHFTRALWPLGTPGVGRGFALADLDGNGWLDLVRRDLLGETRVDLQACGAEGWLRIALSGPAPNTRGIGARVEVVAGDRRWLRWIHAGSTSMASSAPPEAHVGVGDLDVVDLVRVTWPDGGIQEFSDVETRQRLAIWRE